MGLLETGKKYINMPHAYDIFKLEKSMNDAGDHIYNITTRVVESFNDAQEDFILRTITKIGEERGIVFSYNKEKIADALRKRMAKKVEIAKTLTPQWAYCPSCYTALNINVEAIGNPEHLPGYCSCCGQALDWSDIHG